MIDRSHALPLARQAEELGISRGSLYYQPQPVSAADLALMRRMDELHLEFPFAGSRMLRDLLLAEDFTVGRLHVATLMKRMGSRRSTASPPPPSQRQNTRSIPICCASCPSPDPIRSGPWI